MSQARVMATVLLLFTITMGCVSAGNSGGRVNRARLKQRALSCLRKAVQYAPNAAVRAAAVEALSDTGLTEVEPWIRTSLHDDQPVVRFAGCVAVGVMKDANAQRALGRCLSDPQTSVRVGAIFGLHRLGDTRASGRLASYLLFEQDTTVRRNAAFVLGLLGEEGAVKLLARAMRDPDPGLRQIALESMARLGNREAKQELVFMTNAGVGQDEVFALRALADSGDPAFIDTFDYKFNTAVHLETRLAAARGLNMHGREAGVDLAERALRGEVSLRDDPADPVNDQRLRLRLLACLVLASAGRAETLPLLDHVLTSSKDARVQVAVARTILQIVETGRSSVFTEIGQGK